MHLSDSEMGDNDVETNNEISVKVSSGVYKLSRNNSKKNRSYCWDIFHLILLEDSSVLQSRLYCIRCSKVLTSRGLSTSNLRRHRCFLKYLDEIGVSDASHIGYSDETNFKNDRIRISNAVGGGDKNERIRNSNGGDSLSGPIVTAKLELQSDDAELNQYDDDANDTNFDMDDGEDSILSTERSISAPKRPRTTQGDDDGDDEVSQTSRVAANCSSISAAKLDALRANATLPAKSQQSNQSISEREDEADIFAKAWAQAYRKLTEEQQFYAKRGIDELLVLGRLERLTLNTVTVLGNK